MPIAIALVMGALAAEFFMPPGPAEEVIQELALDRPQPQVDLSFSLEPEDALAKTKPEK